MTKLERKLKVTLRRLSLAPDSSVLVGVSGGADSMALLDAMHRLRQQDIWRGEVYSAHVNHLLRGAESDADEAFVQDRMATLPVKLLTIRLNVAAQAQTAGQNLEATARQARYDFFQRVARENDAPLVFTAHTADDQVETLLMRWLRGAGADGLRGIHEVSELCAGVRLVRPMLDVTRAEVLEHCAHYGVEYRTDSSNLSDDYTRNRVRHQLLPLLQSFNPQFGAALQRGAAHWRSDAECLDEQAARIGADGQLSTRALAESHTALRGRVLRAWVKQICGNLRQISAVHWQALERLVVAGQSGRTVELPRGWRVTREFDQLRLWQATEVLPAPPEPVCLVAGASQAFGGYEFVLHSPMTWSAAEQMRRANPSAQIIALSEEQAARPLWLRARQPGDAYVPVGKTSPVKLKTLLIRHQIPLSQRAAHPLLATAEGDIIWSPDLPLARAFQANPASARCVLVIARERCNLPNATGVMSKARDA